MQHRWLKIIVILIGAIIVAAAIYFFTQTPNNITINSGEWKSEVKYPDTPITLTFWTTEEESGNLDQVINDYQQKHPNVKVNVEYISSEQYQTQVVNAINANTLPDIISFRGDGLPLYKNAISPAPGSVFSKQTFESAFVPFASSQLSSGNTIYGVPLGVATLGLIYNQTTVANKKLNIPDNWNDFVKFNEQLRQKEGQSLYASGVALGTAAIRNYPDIISILMMQNGAKMTDTPPTKATFDVVESDGYSPGAKALDFYGSFAQSNKQNYTWSDSLGGSIEALANGKTQAVIDYPMSLKQIRKINPNGNFLSAKLPQINVESPVNYGLVGAAAVTKNSKNSEIAWDFLGFITSKAEQEKYSQTSLWPVSRQDLVEQQKNDKDLGASASQTASATDWYKGINFITNEIMREMITTHLSGFDSRIAVKNAANKITAEFNKLK